MYGPPRDNHTLLVMTGTALYRATLDPADDFLRGITIEKRSSRYRALSRTFIVVSVIIELDGNITF